ncbi:GNAT family N-acetyltransferase [Brumimicrobium aurantiacum]|uniref:GNAT family N-acetyltransferase n=1 Tax=Brumimicrobium aurantiacum TaxID=1737063 RepID=A0A3E1F2F2_9FLAO|nr:GNAT family N-acetyltransferase [Brumimicrobium aurantiacum]RFC55994.1 GNAT family N-acetyltransferase [Brumimicrobium aurantiacum]
MPKGTIRKAKQGDEIALMGLVQELADFEKAPDEVINTPEQLAIDLFEDHICDCFVYEIEGVIRGMALYYISYSTWRGRCLYLEDLYIQPDYRRNGIGKELFSRLVEEAKSLGVKRMDWQVLDWNTSAIDFYKGIGATLDPEWYNGRLFFD